MLFALSRVQVLSCTLHRINLEFPRRFIHIQHATRLSCALNTEESC
ncbi:hypothetical protein Plhal304r1_c002g0006111 [Plasmopara halstedii]